MHKFSPSFLTLWGPVDTSQSNRCNASISSNRNVSGALLGQKIIIKRAVPMLTLLGSTNSSQDKTSLEKSVPIRRNKISTAVPMYSYVWQTLESSNQLYEYQSLNQSWEIMIVHSMQLMQGSQEQTNWGASLYAITTEFKPTCKQYELSHLKWKVLCTTS